MGFGQCFAFIGLVASHHLAGPFLRRVGETRSGFLHSLPTFIRFDFLEEQLGAVLMGLFYCCSGKSSTRTCWDYMYSMVAGSLEGNVRANDGRVYMPVIGAWLMRRVAR